ncbi:P-loop containing nucleoside triphosphate hydrolase protein [Ceratobasidium sp. AG-I]|nr:P-loop containing nucleoside triphosphate hydrolase protein [Ceratobasidium sp. AG-I]
MLKFMAWERNFERRAMGIRDKELKYQKQSYLIQILFSAIWDSTPAVCIMTLASFFHYAVIRQQDLKPSIAFTALAVFNELRFALNTLPETIVNVLQSIVSAKRIEKYMSTADVSDLQSIKDKALDPTVKLVSASISWPQQRAPPTSGSTTPYTPRTRFTIPDLSAEFPKGELSLVCGRLGSGKSLLLLALLGEADVLAGQVIAPRSPSDTLAYLSTQIDLNESNWIVEGVCAYVPQTAWLQNESIQNNILFGLPLNEARYQQTIKACALVPDFAIIEDGDQAEIGERGVNLSGGQKARVSLARAIYSRASVLLLDDVLSAVDAHTASHLVDNCLRGPLTRGRTVVLVSHHIQLVLPGASYVVALDNGRVLFSGPQPDFVGSSIMQKITHSTKTETDEVDEKAETSANVEKVAHAQADLKVEASAEDAPMALPAGIAPAGALGHVVSVVKAPRKLIEDEARATGRVKKEIWVTYFRACGSYFYWIIFFIVMLGGSLAPIVQNGWLRYWSAQAGNQDTRGPLWYITIYAVINLVGMLVQTLRWYVLYDGSIRASSVLYKRLLEAVLFTTVRFHDTISRGRLLNRFGKDFEGLDSKIADDLGHALVCALNVLVTLVTITFVGGIWFFMGAVALVILSYNVAKVYGQTSRDLRRLDSVTRSPLYSIYGETIAGVTVIRAFGASTKFLREMFRRVDTNSSPYHGTWSVNRWVSLRLTMVSGCVVTISAVAIMLDKSVQASFAGFALSLAVGTTYDLILFVRRFVGLEQSMIALERVEEFSVIPREGVEFVEPRPRTSWPEKGQIVVEDLVIRYAPDLPKVLHNLSFKINAGSKIGVLGRTGGGKSTLALSFFRFVEAAEGRIIIDGVDISQLGLTDLRSRITIIPQDPTILSGTVRSTLDIFGEYEDHEIFEALRRVHLLPSLDEPLPEANENMNMFQDLDSPVSEGGENFSAGEKQLMCMARAILKRSKILFCDEGWVAFTVRVLCLTFAACSVDYATDELISQTIRKEFVNSTIVTIAHRLRTIIDYDKTKDVFPNMTSPAGCSLIRHPSEGGENFSAGEKQLMCMARAILKRSKILFCDEGWVAFTVRVLCLTFAACSVDYATDELISQTIRKEFVNSTIVTIAHRLRTIIDYDKVMVLDQGRISEYDGK